MGWTYNTLNPNAETNAPTITAVGVAFTTISLVTVLLRFYVRAFMIKKIGTDDWIILFTWFMSLGFMVVTILQTKWGLGLQHLSDMPDANIFQFGVLQYAGAPFYISSILGFKLSLLFSFHRIAVQKAHRIAIIAIMFAVTAFHLSFLIVQINLCNPIAKQWDPAITVGSCLTAVPFYTSMASITILFDVIIMFLPFPVLLQTAIPMRKKLILLALFSLGTFITIIQIVRIQTIHSLQNYIDSSALIMWSMVENNLGITIASIPPLSPLIKSLKNGSTNRSYGPGGSSGQKGSSYVLGSIAGTSGLGGGRRGSMPLRSHTDRDDVEGAQFKSRTTVKGGTQRGFEGDNSSEEHIINTHDGIMAVTEVVISSDAKEGGQSRGDPFKDPRSVYAH